MKIGLLAENYFPTLGGIQEHVYYLAKHLLKNGHEVKVITGMPRVKKWQGPQDEDWVIRVGRSVSYGVMGTYTNFTLSPKIARNLRLVFKQHQFDILHIHGPFDFGLPLLAYRNFKGPIVATLHSAFKDSISRRLVQTYYKWIIRRTSAIIAVSQHAANSMLRYSDFPYQIIPNGVDIESFQQGQKLEQYIDGNKNILYLGRVEPRNGLDILFQALPSLLQKHPNIRILVAGDGPELESYKKLIPESLKHHVEFLGAVYQERADLYKTADLFVLPNRFGGTFSIMVLEALAAGTPVVSTPFVPRECRNSHWDSAWICQDHSPEALASGINAMLENNPSARIEQGHAIVKKYNWPIVAQEICNTYQKLLETNRR